jgi:hypothetical protein
VSQLPRPSSGPSAWLGRRLVLVVGLAAVTLLGLGAWANALGEPVVRAGAPTASVTPPPPRPTPKASPTPTPGATPTASPTASAKPEASAKPSPKPTKKGGSFTTSTAKQGSVSGMGTQHTFIVKVETATGLDANEVAKQVAGILNDPRSWTGSGTVRFALVKDAGKADFTVYVSAPKLADGKCGADAWVCVRGGKVVLAAAGWQAAAATYAGDTTGFRRYLVNNAVGTYLGEDKASCRKAGQPAPVMAPQGDDLKGCTPNPWPFG